MPRRTRKGASTALACGDLLTLAADIVGAEPAHRAHGRGVVADGQVLVAARLGRPAHLLDGGAPV